MQSFREMTFWEEALFRRFFELPFQGSRELNTQIETAMVRQIDSHGSLDLWIEHGEKSKVKGRVPIEAWCPDRDGILIRYLLHVVNGFANELEIYKDDGSKIIEKEPQIKKIEIFSL